MSRFLNLKEEFSNKEAAETRKVHLRQNGTPSKGSDSPREFQSDFIEVTSFGAQIPLHHRSYKLCFRVKATKTQ